MKLICLLCAVLRLAQSHIAISIIAYSGAWRMGWLAATCAVPPQIRNDWNCRYAINNKTALLRIIGRTATLPYLTIGNVATITPKIQLNGDTKNMKITISLQEFCKEYKRKTTDYGDGMTERVTYHRPLQEFIEEYNRKTTDYGNGMMEIVTYHHPKQKYIGDDRLESKKKRKKKPKLSDEEQEKRTRKQIYAIRRRIKGYALINDFNWFVTLTLDPEKINSIDYNVAKTTLLKWCRKIRDRYGKFDYLLVPELHKSGAIHFHGMLGDIPANFVEAVNLKTNTPVIRHERQVYNLADWEYGFSDCEKIESPERAASYITKYVTSDLLTDKKMYNQKRYFCSQGLKKPTITFGMEDNTALNNFIPNYGIVDTDDNGKNYVDIGLYKLVKDTETGAFVQKDTDYLIKAKNKTEK